MKPFRKLVLAASFLSILAILQVVSLAADRAHERAIDGYRLPSGQPEANCPRHRQERLVEALVR